MSKMIDVTVQVPEGRVGDFHIAYGQWLQRVLSEAGSVRQPWSGEDAELAERVWERLPANAARLLDLLVSNGEMDGPSLVQELGLNDVSQIVGLNGWVGRICNEVGRKSPVRATPGAHGTIWTVDPGIRHLFAGGRQAVGRKG